MINCAQWYSRGFDEFLQSPCKGRRKGRLQAGTSLAILLDGRGIPELLHLERLAPVTGQGKNRGFVKRRGRDGGRKEKKTTGLDHLLRSFSILRTNKILSYYNKSLVLRIKACLNMRWCLHKYKTPGWDKHNQTYGKPLSINWVWGKMQGCTIVLSSQLAFSRVSLLYKVNHSITCAVATFFSKTLLSSY